MTICRLMLDGRTPAWYKSHTPSGLSHGLIVVQGMPLMANTPNAQPTPDISGGYAVDILIPESEITSRVNALAREINSHYKTMSCPKLVVVGLLRGSFMFIADLVRRLDLPVEVDFMTVSSYGKDMVSSREVRILKDLDTELGDVDVLVVEDIIDTGITLAQVLGILRTRKPRSLEVCCLLDKPTRREVEVDTRWTGFEIPDEFVVGYGIDYAENNRNLPHIGKVRTRQ